MMFFAMAIMAYFSAISEVVLDKKELGVEIKRVRDEIWYIHNIQLDQKTCDSINNCTINRSFEYQVESFVLSDSKWNLNNSQMGNIYTNGYISYKKISETRTFSDYGFFGKYVNTELNLLLDKKEGRVIGKEVVEIKNKFAFENLIFLLGITFFSAMFFLLISKYGYRAHSLRMIFISFIIGLLTIIFLAVNTDSIMPFGASNLIVWILLILCTIFYIYAVNKRFNENFTKNRIRFYFYPIICITYIFMYNIYTGFDFWIFSLIAIVFGLILSFLYRGKKELITQ